MKNFNIFLFKLLLFISFIVFSLCNNIIYLDNNFITFNVEKVKVTMTGDFINDLVIILGTSGAFIVGSKIGYSAIAKSSLGFFGKTGASAGAGAGFVFTWKLAIASHKYLTGKGSLTQDGTNSMVKIDLENLNISQNLNGILDTQPLQNIQINNSLKEQLIKDMQDNFINKLGQGVLDKIGISSNEQGSKVIQYIELIEQPSWSISEQQCVKTNELTKGIEIEEIKTKISSASTDLINSPLEPSEINMIIKDQVIELLSYNFILHIIMLYLIFMLIFIFSMKFVIDNKISIEKVQNLPLGKYIYNILNKIINTWSKTNTFWIFFLSISLFIIMSVSTFGLYACLFLLN